MKRSRSENDYESHTITQSEHDDRVYKYLVLSNKLKVLLVSDDSADKAAAAVDVHVGNLAEPDDLPGLAHFCEHMLFMGTKKYPKENEFSQYLSEHGGSSNAYTSSENTTYYFDVGNEAFPGALDRFSQFFTCPLFDAETRDREVQAIDSEHQQNLNSDLHRLDRVDRLTSKKGHVYQKFITGNLKTLQEEPAKKNIDIREALLEFHDKYYSANIMALAVVSKDSIEALEEMVIPMFSEIINKDVEIPIWNEHPFGENEYRKLMKVVSVKEMKRLKLKFPLPDLQQYYESKPADYVVNLIGHEGEGSLLSLLKDEGLVNELLAWSEPEARGFHFFNIQMELSEDGMDQIDEIIAMIFQYIKLISDQAPMEWFFNEMKNLNEISFKFKDKEQADWYVTSLVSNMQKYPAKDILNGDHVWRCFRPDLIREVLSNLTPNKVRCTTASQVFEGETDMVDDIYGTCYTVSEIPLEKIQAWSNLELHPELQVPKPNPFMPESLELVVNRNSGNDKEMKIPELIMDTELMRVWFKSDDTYFLPKACNYIKVDSSIANSSPIHANHLRMFVYLIKDALAEFAYDAELAGIDYSIYKVATGLQIYLYGYNDKMLVLLEKILQNVISLDLKEERFKIFKEELRQSLINKEAEQPYYTIDELKKYVLEENNWLPEDLLASLEAVSLQSLQSYIHEFLQFIYIEALIAGNLLLDDANKIISVMNKMFDESKPMLGLHHFQSRELMLPSGCSYLYEKRNTIHHMSCVQTYLQFGPQGTTTNALAALLCQTLDEPCFDTLRTKEQLGYVVFSYAVKSQCALGLVVLVHSDKEPSAVEDRIDKFLVEFETTLTDLSEEEFDNFVQAVIVKKLEKPKYLNDECYRYWKEIRSKQYHFNRAKIEVEELKKLRKEDLLDLYRRLVLPTSLTRRKLTLVILGKDAEPICGKNAVNEKNWNIINNVLSFKYTLPLYPLIPPYPEIPIVHEGEIKQ